jgi:hypothetical protein
MRCCCALTGVTALGGLLCVAWVLSALASMRADAPLSFAPVEPLPFEAAVVSGKLETAQLGARLFGSDATEIALDERELNVLLFSEPLQTDEDKARLHLDGDLVRIESSRRQDDGSFLNVQATLALSIEGGQLALDLQRARIGDYELGGWARGVFVRLLLPRLQADLQANPHLQRLQRLRVDRGVVYLSWEND